MQKNMVNLVIPEIGKVEFNYSLRAKKLRLCIKSTKEIIITVPYSYTLKQAENFVLDNLDWLHKNLTKLKQSNSIKTIFSPDKDFHTKNKSLIWQKKENCIYQINITTKNIIIQYEKESEILSNKSQNLIRKTIEDVFYDEALFFLPKQLSNLAQKLNFNFQKCRIKKQKTLWGSCSSLHNINLNFHLIRLPSQFIDYVLIHELCHLEEANHSHSFWCLVDKSLGKLWQQNNTIGLGKIWNKKLQSYKILYW